MTAKERMHIYYWNLTPETPFCINCGHFHRHYISSGDALDCGHCCCSRMKMRLSYDTCEKFEKGGDDKCPSR